MSNKQHNFNTTLPQQLAEQASEWYKIDQDNQSYLCIQSALSESGSGSSLSQYYMVENAFALNAPPIIYYYYF